jgi:hypothetical protein
MNAGAWVLIGVAVVVAAAAWRLGRSRLARIDRAFTGMDRVVQPELTDSWSTA